jgi:D-alanyl-D-alanine carboxypeptidase (penicillin-binding protein 5/6)
MLTSTGTSLRVVRVMEKDARAATVKAAWGSETSALAARDASIVVWPGLPIQTSLEAQTPLPSVKRGAELGTIVVTAGDQRQEVPVVAQESVSSAGLIWRLTRGPSTPW